MNVSDAEYAAALVARRLGLPVSATLPAQDHLVITPNELHEHDGFSVEIRTSWRTAEVRFSPGKFARPLLDRMGAAGPEAQAAFSALASAATKQGKLIFRVNGTDLNPQRPSDWPSNWRSLELLLKRQGVVFEELPPGKIKQLLGNVIAPLFGMCIALIGIEDVDADASASEGDAREILSRRYERRPVNREICLSVRGQRCFCCNIDFGEVYGAFADGYIEIHHTTPASEMGPGYKINPVTELVPVCSNCHSVIHLTKPARNVNEVKAIFEGKRASNERPS
jgi:5-methylcytosine-specific restriction protein A